MTDFERLAQYLAGYADFIDREAPNEFTEACAKFRAAASALRSLTALPGEPDAWLVEWTRKGVTYRSPPSDMLEIVGELHEKRRRETGIERCKIVPLYRERRPEGDHAPELPPRIQGEREPVS